MFSISSPSFPSFSHEPNTNTNTNTNPNPIPNPAPAKRKRNLPGTPDPDAEVIALSPMSLMATNRFVCEVCNKGFQRDQNLQLHRRGHNLPWKLKQRSGGTAARKKVYVCPERSCVHHGASRALGDLTGIKKHFSRKHGEKRWKCEKCSKKYAVQSDWKAHSKTCGTRQYKCDCATLFSRKDSFITHRAFCDALTDESARTSVIPSIINNISFDNNNNESNVLASTTRTHDLPLGFSRQDVGVTPQFVSDMMTSSSDHDNVLYANNSNNSTALPANTSLSGSRQETLLSPKPPAAPMSATALLQKAAQVGSTSSKFSTNGSFGLMRSSSENRDRRSGNDDVGMADLERIMMQSLGEPKLNTGSTGPTRDFLGVGGESSRFMHDELARFASFGPRAAMGFGQFANNH